MPNDVFANGREISCKAADGKSICAFPDVCMTPPTPPAGFLPIPYPNTGFATDTTNGSTTVKISGKEVMLKNKSYFKKSTGDEAATRSTPMGVLTATITGKVYFTSWSMDVKVEGENVVRMADLTTHNHMSMPGNTPTWPYLDEQSMSTGACKNERENERAKCKAAEESVNTSNIPQRSKNKAMRDAYCADPECKEARKCMLQPYDPELGEGQTGCCDNKTGHHVIPVHCFMPPGERAAGGSARYAGCDGYDPKKAPCICVEGAGKEKEHGDIHEICDMLEDMHMADGKAGSWSYENASLAGAMSINEVTGCDEACIKAQTDAYHQQKEGAPNIQGNTALRADSLGTRTPDGFTPSVTAPGSAF